MDRYPPPLLIVAVDDPADRHFADRVLSSSGWRTEVAEGAMEIFTCINLGPALILLSHENSVLADHNFPETISRFRTATMRVPILGWGDHYFDPAQIAFDDTLPKPCSAEQLIRAAERWRPEALPPAFITLRKAFGDAAAMDLLGRFQQLLLDAVQALATDHASELAHRVAGMAGMLGFTALGRQWLSLSEGEGVEPVSLRRATLRAIVAIDHAGV